MSNILIGDDHPSVIAGLAAQLNACTSWESYAEGPPEVDGWPIYYPHSPGNATYPHAVIFSPESSPLGKLADGSQGLRNGSASIWIYSRDTTGKLEKLAETLCRELVLRQTGLVITEADYSPAGVPDIAEQDQGPEGDGEPPTGVYVVEIIIQFGLTGS